MTHKAKPTILKRRRRRDRGSALLVSLMIMVGLSLLGLSFVAISETENAISINERNKSQTTALAEAGAKAVVSWFQDPTTMTARNLLPANDNDFKTQRVVNAYTGYYKPTGMLCDTPFGPREPDMFFGDEAHADITIVDGANDDSTAFITAFNNAIYYNTEAGRVVSIRIYAPPNVGGTLVNGFWLGGQRYGVATVAVTAEKRNRGGAVIAQSIVRLVLAPFPLPGPSGAVQALGNIASNGAYEVHWGAIESEDDGNMYIKREPTALPWFDPYDRPYMEYGYDSSSVWLANTEYVAAPFPRSYVVRPSNAAIAQFNEYAIVATTGSGDSGPDEPTWDTTPGAVFTKGQVTYRQRSPTVYPIRTADATGYRNHHWLSELLKREVEDPWFAARTHGRIDGKDTGLGPNGDPHPEDYATDPIAQAGDYAAGVGESHYFQYQTYSNRPLYKEVKIPKFDYDFWKAAAIAGRGQKGIHYLEYAGGNFTNGIKTQSFGDWIAEGPGFFFFDTANGLNPQNGGPGELVDATVDPCGAKGVIYGNFTSMNTTGCGGTDGQYNQPGEPYRDIGYRRVNIVTSGAQVKGNFTTDAAGNYATENAFNAKWDYQDLPWSNGAAATNDVFDVCIAERPLWRESTSEVLDDEFVPLPYFPGCTPGNNRTTPGCNCSEPHEPYLNLHYDGTKLGIQAYWDDPAAASSVRAKQTNDGSPTGTLVTCTADSVSTKAGQEQCTTNAYDKIGGRALLDKGAGFAAPGVEGVLYNEGDYGSTGNAAYYGAVVVGGTVDPKGTQEIWYDSCLANDCWPPRHIPFPRVMITSTQIQ